MSERMLQWPTSAGPVVLIWNDGMEPEEAAIALEAVQLACRAIQMIAEQRLPVEEYGQAMNAAMGAAQ